MARLNAADAKRRIESAHGPDFLEALARGLSVITAFGAGRRSLSLSEIAGIVGLPRATARRSLHTLERLGYAESDGKLYRLTPRVLALATAYLDSNPISTLLQPVCERLSAATRGTSSVAVLDGQEVVFIAHASPSRLSLLGSGLGYRLPAFCTALGRVLLAALDDAALHRFLAQLAAKPLTGQTVTDGARLQRLIERARKDGYAIVDNEAEPGFRSIAVPLRKHDGRVVAALNIGMPVESGSIKEARERLLPRLQACAADLAAQLI